MPSAQLLLIFEARLGEATLERLRAALDASPVARPAADALASAQVGGVAGAISPVSSVLIVPVAFDKSTVLDKQTVAALVALAQSRGVAALIYNDADLARAVAADGVHLVVSGDPSAAYRAARASIGKDHIVGVEITDARHEAMIAGELGADYLAFSGPDCAAMVTWWADLFVLPCVAMGLGPVAGVGIGVASPHEGALLADAGADFIAVALATAQTPGDIQSVIRAFGLAAAAGCLPG
jgi:thiamine-phosphate pyrophosphorylase